MVKRIKCKVIKSITLKNNNGYSHESKDICIPAKHQLNIKYAQRNDPGGNNISFGYYKKLLSALSFPDNDTRQLLDFRF